MLSQGYLYLSLSLTLGYFLSRMTRQSLRFHYFLLGILLLPPFIAFIPGHIPLPTVSSVFVPPSAPQQKIELIKEVFHKSTPAPRPFPFKTLPLFFLLCGVSLAFGKILKDQWSLARLLKNAHIYKKRGRVQIFLSSEVSIPFSYYRGNAGVVVPLHLLERREDFRCAVYHELQHHRQGDTRWIYFLEILQSLFFWNPLIALWCKDIFLLQEIACDEAVIGRTAISAQAYGRSLLRVARTQLNSHRRLTGTVGMAVRGSQLKRRIAMILQKRKTPRFRGWIGTAVGMMACLTAAALGNQLRAQKLTMERASQLAQSAALRSSIPLPINEAVLEQLNYYVGTEDGQQYIKNALARAQAYRGLISKKIAAYRLPAELAAIPIMESGYQNLTPDRNPSGAAGLWQFMKGTAKNYNLNVDTQVDDRLNVEKETDAALRYLQSLYLRFQDWHLAFVAYNAGEMKVQDGINTTHTRDAWKLIDAGYGGDSAYLARILAAMIVLNNPAVLD